MCFSRRRRTVSKFAPAIVALETKVQICGTSNVDWQVCLLSLQPIPNFRICRHLATAKMEFWTKNNFRLSLLLLPRCYFVQNRVWFLPRTQSVPRKSVLEALSSHNRHQQCSKIEKKIVKKSPNKNDPKFAIQ